MKLNESIDLMRIANEWNQSEIGTESEPDFDGNSQQDNKAFLNEDIKQNSNRLSVIEEEASQLDEGFLDVSIDSQFNN